MKICTGCGVNKPLDAYHVSNKTSDGHAFKCKICMAAYWQSPAGKASKKRYSASVHGRQNTRKHHLKTRFDITLQEYQDLWDAQAGVCAICGLPETRNNYNLFVDHDHVTGKIRGLLCNSCNAGIGFFKDNPSLMDSAKEYLGAQCPSL